MKQAGTLPVMKELLVAASVVSCLLSGCRQNLGVKIYFLDAEQGGLVRKQANEVRPFSEARGYRCLSPQDFNSAIMYLNSLQRETEVKE